MHYLQMQWKVSGISKLTFIFSQQMDSCWEQEPKGKRECIYSKMTTDIPGFK